ncbi:MAG: hypothetical protein JWO20_638 [Candidatus Angelobacter sp.]|jgi:hypothetical protein|nr:hypothetical protein [Candidatus Angelobacter sp.]
MSKILRTSAPFLFLMAMTSPAFAGDLEYTRRIVYGNGPSHDTVYYVKGERQRIDSQSSIGGQTKESFIYGPHTAMIMQCDLNRVLLLNLDTKKYFVHDIKPHPTGLITGILSAGRLTGGTAANTSYTEKRDVSVKETGDKRDFHNHEAWLVRQTTESTRNYDGHLSQSTSVEETWYIDLDAPMYCRKQMGLPPNTKVQSQLGTVGENVTETHTGTARIGFPVSQQYHVISPSQSQSSMEVVDWSEEPLDPKLFEVPNGFVETKNEDEVNPPFGRVSKAAGAWENFVRWAQHFFSMP